MDRVVNIQPVFIDYDVVENTYDSNIIKFFLSILLIITTVLLFIFFLDEITFMFSVIFKAKVAFSQAEIDQQRVKVQEIEELLKSTASCTTTSNNKKVGILIRSETLPSYFLMNTDETLVIYENIDECNKFIASLKN